MAEKTPLETELETAERKISEEPTDEELLLAVGASQDRQAFNTLFQALLEENLRDGYETYQKRAVGPRLGARGTDDSYGRRRLSMIWTEEPLKAGFLR